jgi:uncharacterized membrane-anchored protein YjiN (DUF445 family)
MTNDTKIQADIKQYEIDSMILEITGQNMEVQDALEQWSKEHQQMLMLFDENQAYRILNRRLLMALTIAEQTTAAIKTEALMFITPKTRSLIEKFETLNWQIKQTKIDSDMLNQGVEREQPKETPNPID